MRPGWSAASLGGLDDFADRLTERGADDLIAGVAAFRRRGVPIEDVGRDNFSLHAFADALADVRRELTDGRGIMMLRGFPVDRLGRQERVIAYLGLGAYLGSANRHTPAQKEAIALYRATVEACAVDIDLVPGDIQFLNNFVTLHTRRAYEDWPEPERKRHLLRLWRRSCASDDRVAACGSTA